MEYKDEIIKKLQELSGGYSVHAIFTDWVEMMALGFSNTVDDVNKPERETRYKEISRRYSEEQNQKLSELTGLLTMACDHQIEDVLGYVYMHLEGNSSSLGQFFTPYHLCQLMAETSIKNIVLNQDIYKPLVVNEPSCGAGGNVIALAECLLKKGINYQHVLRVICQDLDWRAVYMTYVQMFLYGIPARVIQGDSLAAKKPDKSHVFVTKQQKEIEVMEMMSSFMSFYRSVFGEGDTPIKSEQDTEETVCQMVQKASIPPEQIMSLVEKKQPKPKKGQATIYELLED